MSDLLHKSFSAEHTKIAPKPSDLEAIQKHAPTPVDEEAVFVGHMTVCNDSVDRSHERFTRAYLKRFAETLPGKALMPGHNYGELPIGRIYDAEVRKTGEGHELHARYYVDARDEKTVRAIELGVYKDVSIGFKAGPRLCDLCERDYDGLTKGVTKDACEHIAGELYDGQTCTLTYAEPQKAEAMETSFVWLGCQYGAQTIGHGAAAAISQKAALVAALPRKEPPMPDEPTEKAAAPPDDVKALQAENASLKGLAADGKRYRERLQKEIVRLSGVLELGQLGEMTAKAVLHAPVAELEALEAELSTRVNQALSPTMGSTASGADHRLPAAEGASALNMGFNPFAGGRR